jgi:putative transposase
LICEKIAKIVVGLTNVGRVSRIYPIESRSEGIEKSNCHQNVPKSSGFISKWKQIYALEGLSALKLAHKGATGYLKIEQRKKIIEWLQAKNYWNLGELKAYIEEQYEVVFISQQSYYDLFEQAGISWKKTQKSNPKTDPELVKKNDRIDGMVRMPPSGN